MDRVRMERRCTSYQRVVIWIQGYTITWWDIWYNWITFQLLNGTDYKKYIWYVHPIWWILLGTLNVELQPQNFCSFRQSTDTATCQLTTFAYIKHQMYVNSSLILIIHFVAAYLACQIMEYQKGGHMAGNHYSDVIMGVIASQITSLPIVYSTVYSGADQRKHQSSASQTFVRWIPGTNGQ